MRDLVLGNHSADLANFRATADFKSSSALKFAKNYESSTATPRILEEDDRTLCEKSTPSVKVDFMTNTIPRFAVGLW